MRRTILRLCKPSLRQASSCAEHRALALAQPKLGLASQGAKGDAAAYGCSGESSITELRKLAAQRRIVEAAAANWATVQPAPDAMPELDPLTAKNLVSGNAVPASVKFEVNIPGVVNAKADSNCDFSIDVAKNGMIPRVTAARDSGELSGSADMSVGLPAMCKQAGEVLGPDSLAGGGLVDAAKFLKATGSDAHVKMDHRGCLASSLKTEPSQGNSAEISMHQEDGFSGAFSVSGMFDSNGLHLFTDTSSGPFSSSLISGTVTADHNGNITSGDLNFDVQALCERAGDFLDINALKQLAGVLETANVEGLQIFWGEKVCGGQITVDGVDLSLKKMQLDVRGSSESSNFVYDEQGNVAHYHGAIEVTSGKVDALYAGVGAHVPGLQDANVHADVKVAAQNNFTSDLKTHVVYVSEGMVVDNRTEVHTTDKSFEVLDVKVGGTTECHVHSVTLDTRQSEGVFVSSTKQTKVEEHLHTKTDHGVIEDDVKVLQDETVVSCELLECHLTAAGYGGLTVLVKPIMAAIKAGGGVTPVELAKIVAQSAAGVASLALLSRVFSSPAIAMAVMVVAQNAVPLVRGDYEQVKRNMGPMLKSILVVQGASWATRTALLSTPLAPYSSVLGAGAGLVAGSVVADIDLQTLRQALRRELSRQRIKLIE